MDKTIIKKKVIIIQRIFPHYRKFIFDELAKIEDLLVLHSINESGIKQVTEYYSKQVKTFQYGKKETNIFLNVFSEIIKFKPDVIIHDTAVGILSTPFVLLISKLFRIRFLLWGHGFNMTRGFNSGTDLESKYRLLMMKLSDGYILYGEKNKELLKNYINPKKLFVAKNTVDTDKLTQIKNTFILASENKLKNEMNFDFRYNLIFSGRLIKEKYPDILLQVFNFVNDELNNQVGLHIIGKGYMYEFLITTASKLKSCKNIKFYGSLYEDIQIGKLIYLSDIMVIPGGVGLAVNHAFCFDCPVITFEKDKNGPFHGPEAEYIIEGKTGFFAKHFDSKNMALKIVYYLSNTELQNIIKNNIREFVKAEIPKRKMVDGFLNAIEGR